MKVSRKKGITTFTPETKREETILANTFLSNCAVFLGNTSGRKPFDVFRLKDKDKAKNKKIKCNDEPVVMRTFYLAKSLYDRLSQEAYKKGLSKEKLLIELLQKGINNIVKTEQQS